MPSRTRLFPVVLLLGFVLAAGLLMAYRNPGGRARADKVALPDGSQIRFWKATFGSNHFLVLGRFPELDGLRSRFPWVQRVLGPTTLRMTGGWPGNGMCLFYHWEDSMGFPKPNPPWVHATLDEHGCLLEMDSGRGESELGGTNIAYQYSGLYPRRMAAFEAAFRPPDGTETGGVRVLIRNPNPWRGTPWVPEAVPAVREVDGLTVHYLGFGGSDRWPGPRFRVEQGGQERPEWSAGRIYFRDVTGNESQMPSLCRHEAAWEIEASFERVPEFGFGPDEAWTIHSGNLPGAGESKELQGSPTLQGVTMRPLMTGGAGRFELERRGGPWRVIRSEAPKPGDQSNGASWGNDSTRQWMNLNRSRPWLMIDMNGLTPDLTWKVVARDAAGKCHANQGWSSSGSTYTVDLEIPKDMVVTEVQIIVQRWRTVAFRVPPPKILSP